MSKREDLRRQRQSSERRNKFLIILGIAIIAVLVAVIIITSQLNSIGKIVSITPEVRPQSQGMTMGNSNAPVKMDIYSDFQCPACKRLAENVEPGLVENYVKTGKLLITYHPFKVIGPESDAAAEAAYCAADQNKFWDFHDILYANWTGENVGDFSTKRLKAYAENLKLDMTAFNQCLDNGKYKNQISEDQKAGDTIPLSFTPSVFINGVLDETGNYAATIDKALTGN